MWTGKIFFLLLAVQVGQSTASSLYQPPPPPGGEMHHHHAAITTTTSRSTLQKSPPRVQIDQLALLLRWTCEVNRRLQLSSRECGHQDTTSIAEDETNLPPPTAMSHSNGVSSLDSLRGGQTALYRIPSTTAFVDKKTLRKEEDLTIFHAKAPRPGQRGTARWGPELPLYLKKLTQTLDITEGGVEWTLALIYLDRACSVETPRTHGVPCVFVGPRTVHRLVLAALLLAVEATHQNDDASAVRQYYCNKVSVAFDIPLERIQQMVDWMQVALGDFGLFVAPYQVQDFGDKWNLRFGHGDVATQDDRGNVKISKANHVQNDAAIGIAPALQQA